MVNLGHTLPASFTSALDQLSLEFMGKWGIVGMGDSYPQGELILEVLTTEDPEVTAEMLPAHINGYPVRVIHSGKIILH